MNKVDYKTIETIRLLSADAVEKANSGHPGLPMGVASIGYTLWKDFLKGSATDPKWVDRDRFVLSAGHGSALLYSLLHLFGYEVSLDDIKNFRQLGSITPGHPEYEITPGIETTTGPLGQGFANGVGMAIAEKRIAAQFNTSDFNLIDHHTYVIAGDGDLMEGISSEAASLAGHLKLGKLIVLYDDNSITIDGSTDITFTEDVAMRFKSYGWEVLDVIDGNDPEEISAAINQARLSSTKPTLIKCKTIIGYGSPNNAGKSKAHGSPLGNEELRHTKELMGWDPNQNFFIPEEVTEHMKSVIDKREINRFLWEEKMEEYFEKYPEKEKMWKEWHDYELPLDLLDDNKMWADLKAEDATRNSGGLFMNYASKYIPNLVGGSADLNGSTKTYLKDFGDFSFENPSGNNIFFGVREHAMGAILNGLALHGGVRAFGATFLVFSDYMKPSIRLAAIMNLPVIYVFTHDSIGVGEDGPTHQPIEHMLMLRSIPNLHVYRPADAKETSISWMEALKRMDGPSAMILSRQNLPLLEGVSKGAHYGAYTLLKEVKNEPDAIIIASGSEVNIAVEASKELIKEGIDTRVVSMISMEVFLNQTKHYQDQIIPKNIKNRISIEAGVKLGWERFIGEYGRSISLDRFGESAPGKVLFRKFGFSVDNIVENVKEMIKDNK